MKSQKPERKRFRPVEPGSLLDKRFKSVIERSKRLRPKIHPLVVLADLRNGSLASLDRYLAQEGGIPDREVAVELRKLISGSRNRSLFRLLVIEHPDGQKNKGGTPAGKRITRVERYSKIATRYRQVYADVGKVWLAKDLVAGEFDCSPSTVGRAIKEEAKAAAEVAALEEVRNRRLTSLVKLRGIQTDD